MDPETPSAVQRSARKRVFKRYSPEPRPPRRSHVGRPPKSPRKTPKNVVYIPQASSAPKKRKRGRPPKVKPQSPVVPAAPSTVPTGARKRFFKRYSPEPRPPKRSNSRRPPKSQGTPISSSQESSTSVMLKREKAPKTKPQSSFSFPIRSHPENNAESYSVSSEQTFFQLAPIEGRSYLDFVEGRQRSRGLSILGVQDWLRPTVGAFYRDVLIPRENGTDMVGEGALEDPGDFMTCLRATALAESIVTIMPRPQSNHAEAEWSVADLGKLIDKDKILAPYLKLILKLVGEQHSMVISVFGLDGGPAVYFTHTEDSATEMKAICERASLYGQQHLNVIHEWMIRHLPTDWLTSYLDIVSLLSSTNIGRKLVSSMMTLGRDVIMNQCHNWLLEFTVTAVADPYLKIIEDDLTKTQQLGNVVMIIVEPNIFAIFGERTHSHDAMFRYMLPALAQTVELKLEVVDRNVNRGKLDMMDIADSLTNHIAEQIEQMQDTYPDSHVVVVGWGTTCRLVQQALENVGGVTAAILFAYPESSILADPDDNANLTYCPTLFVCGQGTRASYIDAILRTQEYYINKTGLVVVNEADVNLRVNRKRLMKERLTQMTIDRAVLEHVRDFVTQVVDAAEPDMKAHRESMKPFNVIEFTRKRKTLKMPPRPSSYQPRGRRGRPRRRNVASVHT
ncbi:hypothetical protein QR680_002015 [Steinernema hermaphroditum]|uniref:KANSL3 helical domain-containing protein n=1 Tax=Steinernema hermaphroditum TaxID=289476 RepID=A0AA39H2Y5_9BILA|nr:hypothetical protein QR680_002015 [Steinernema hermaphroditum]